MTLGRNATEWASYPWNAQPRLTVRRRPRARSAARAVRAPARFSGPLLGWSVSRPSNHACIHRHARITPNMQVLADKAEYRYGQAASLVVQNPYWGPASALVVWGSRLQRKQKFFATVRARGRGLFGPCAPRVTPSAPLHDGITGAPSPTRAPLPPQVPAGVATLPLGALGPECRSGCDARVILSVTRPAGNKAARPVPAVPVSKLFDPLSPHTPTGTVHITVPQVRAPLRAPCPTAWRGARVLPRMRVGALSTDRVATGASGLASLRTHQPEPPLTARPQH